MAQKGKYNLDVNNWFLNGHRREPFEVDADELAEHDCVSQLPSRQTTRLKQPPIETNTFS